MSIPSVSLNNPAACMPEWALLEREVFSRLSRAPELLRDYLTPDGEILWPECAEDFQTFAYGNVDNAFEGFQSFPLLYLMGGDDALLPYAQRQYETLLRQFSRYRKENLGIPEEEAARLGRDTMLVDEMFPDLDWMHNGESMLFFYHLLLANPAHRENRARALRFADIHFGKNPAGFEDNYDPVHKVFKSGYFGSNGPAHEKFKQPIYHSHWMDAYGLAFYDVPGVTTYLDLADPGNAERYGKIYGERLGRCDTVINLLSTSLAACAYAVSGDEKYRRFIVDYVGAWRARAEGYEFMPDNAGPSGRVGETLGGRFYGSHYGWTHPHGFPFIEDALIVAGENERLVTGRSGALDWARDLYSRLIGRYGIPREGGGVLFPHKRADEDSVIEYLGNDQTPMTRPDRVVDFPAHVRYRQVDGFYEFNRANPAHWGHLFADSKSERDLARMKEILPPETLTVSMSNVHKKYKGGQHAAYVRWLCGEYPEYPAEVLRHTLNLYERQRVLLEEEKAGKGTGLGYEPDGEQEWELLRAITREFHEKHGLQLHESAVHAYYQFFLLYRCPLSVEGLLHLTMGAMFPIYNGGLICADARWFDMDRRRPGLAEGVAALITSSDEHGFRVTLANTDARPHTLALQGGAYGEHRILSVEGEDFRLDVNGKWAQLTLAPGTVAELRVSLSRFANPPSLDEPFGAYDRQDPDLRA